jgi:hypothetical protein
VVGREGDRIAGAPLAGNDRRALTVDILTDARDRSIETIVGCGGRQAEAEDIAAAVCLYTEAFWHELRLDAMALDGTTWQPYIERGALRRWMNRLLPDGGLWAKAVGPAGPLARARIQLLADTAELPAFEREVFDQIYLFGHSINECSQTFGLDRDVLAGLLRGWWPRIQLRHAERLRIRDGMPRTRYRGIRSTGGTEAPGHQE